MTEAMFLSGLSILIPNRALWNGVLFQGQKGIPIFTVELKLGGDTVAEHFGRELGLEFYFRLKDD